MAKRDWLKTLGWTEDHVEAVRHTAFSYIRQGKYDIAIPFFEALVVLDPNSAYDFQMLGALYVQIGQPEKAIKYLDKALQADADHGPTLLNLTKAFFMAGRIADGIRLAKLLQNDKDSYISGNASALLMCYS
jgi:tetratricopeptide (TPR) repeat protein